jgi:hypothetical protein
MSAAFWFTAGVFVASGLILAYGLACAAGRDSDDDRNNK